MTIDISTTPNFHGTVVVPDTGAAFAIASSNGILALTFSHPEGGSTTYSNDMIFDFDADGKLLECNVDSADSEFANEIIDQIVDGSLVPMELLEGDGGVVLPDETSCDFVNSYLSSSDGRRLEEEDAERTHPRLSSMEDYEGALDTAEDDEDGDSDGRRRLSSRRTYATLSRDAYNSATISNGAAAAKITGCTVAFRGSDDIADWIRYNANGFWSYYGSTWMRAGFVNHYKLLHSQVRSRIGGCGSNVVFTGHSLGGATAEVARRRNGGTVVTFGAPRLFWGGSSCLSGERYYHENDIVTGHAWGLNSWTTHKTPGKKIESYCKKRHWWGGCKKSGWRIRNKGCSDGSNWGFSHSIQNDYLNQL